MAVGVEVELAAVVVCAGLGKGQHRRGGARVEAVAAVGLE